MVPKLLKFAFILLSYFFTENTGASPPHGGRLKRPLRLLRAMFQTRIQV